MTKAEINARLRNPLSPAKVKKTTIADLEAMVAKEQSSRTADRVMVAVGTLADVKPIRAGTKRHAIVQALAAGCTLEDIMAATGWRKDVAHAALYVDVRGVGLGVERRDGRLHLLMPEGLKRLPIVEPSMSRADALVAACR